MTLAVSLKPLSLAAILFFVLSASGCGKSQVCADGETLCNGVCADLTRDVDDCGACGSACEAGQLCSSGACVQTCSADQTACPTQNPTFCATIASDANNCGACGNPCALGTSCQGGSCLPSCASPLSACPDACVDESNDPLNCGGCGTVCFGANSISTCADASCGALECDTNYADCDSDRADGCETNLAALTTCGTSCADLVDCTARSASATCTAGTCVAPNPDYSIDGSVNAVLHAGTGWYLGGTFQRISKYPTSYVTALGSTGAIAACAIGTSVDGPVYAIATSGNSIYLGGSFTHYQGASANRLAKIDATTCALDTTFSPSASNGADNSVLALAIGGSSLYVGGSFLSYRGTDAYRLVKIDLATGALDTTFTPAISNPGFDNNVEALAIAGTSIYAGGTFNNWQGVANSAAKLAKLDLNSGAIDTTFSPVGSGLNGFDSTVDALAASATSLYVGGFFSAYRGVSGSANRFAKLDLTSGALDTTFSPASGNGFSDVVMAIAISGSSIYAGGRFRTYTSGSTSTSISYLAKLDATSGALDNTTFNPGGSGFSTQINALAVSGATLYAGGNFSSYDSVSTGAIAALDATTGALNTSFAPPDGNTLGFSGTQPGGGTTVIALAMQGTNVWVGGRFAVYGGYAVSNLARLDDVSFAVDTTFSPTASNGFDSTVDALATDGTSLFVGGAFSNYRGVGNSARKLAKLDLASGALDATFSPVGSSSNGFDSAVNALIVSGTSLYAGGAFTAYRGAAGSAERIAKLDTTSGALDTTFSSPSNNGFDATVSALAISGTSLYAGGSFTAYQGTDGSAESLAKLDLTSGALDTTFTQTSSGFDAQVNALAVSGTSLYAGGAFTAYQGVAGSASRLAKLDLTSGALDTTFSPAISNGFDAAVNALTVSGMSLYAGGAFTEYRSVASSSEHLAKLDLTYGALDTTFSPASKNGFDAAVNALGVNGNVLLLGGSFSVYQSASTLTRAMLLVDPTTGVQK